MKWETKAIDNSLNEEIVEGGIQLNQAIAGPFKGWRTPCSGLGLGTHATPYDFYRY